MSFLTTIRNGISGATEFFQQGVKGRWGFFTLFQITFGVLQLLTVITFIFLYSNLVVPSESSFFSLEGILDDLTNGEILFLTRYVSIYMLLFFVVMVSKSGGSEVKKLDFGTLFQRIPFKTFVLYSISVMVTLTLFVYLMNHLPNAFASFGSYNPFQNVGYHEEVWYSTFLKSLMVILLDYLPAIILGYYLISLKEKTWKWEFLWKRLSVILGIVVIVILLQGLYDVTSQIISKLFLATLFQSLENSDILLLFSVLITFTLSIIFNGVLGYTTYFAVFGGAEKSKKEKVEPEESNVDLLDQ